MTAACRCLIATEIAAASSTSTLRLQQHGEPRSSHHDGECSKQDGIHRLEIDPAELACVQLEQPEGVNPLLQQQAVEGTCTGCDQERQGRDRDEPAMKLACLSLGRRS